MTDLCLVVGKMASDETVYCLCRQPYDETRFMIECDVCKDWFHGSCVSIQEHQASDIEIYHCPNCQLVHGPLVLKRRRNWHRHDYSESDENVNKAVQTGTVVFIQELKNRHFTSADMIPNFRMHGSQLTEEYFLENGFTTPILSEKKDGLGLKVPPANFSIQDVENNVGSMREIDVIDVARQEDYKMLMREWTDYYNSPNRSKIFNVISLEFSNTKLQDLVEPPTIVRQLSWVSSYWPESVPDDVQCPRPEVQRYCLMGVKDSFTDFHIDFGGTSVWYHVLRGEKVFYLIRPTPSNMSLYEQWISSSNQSEMFFGDQVDMCYKCVVKQGQTLFIPTGWIHAVLTPIDSLVFGGNFLHSLNIELQLKCYDIERNVGTPEKYLFPSFETVHWYAAKHMLDQIRDYIEEGKKVPQYLSLGAKALAAALKSWTQKKDLNNRYVYTKNHKSQVPETIQYGKLLKELTKEVKQLQQKPNGKTKADEKRKRKKKGLPTGKEKVSLDLLHAHTQKKLEEVTSEFSSRLAGGSLYTHMADARSPGQDQENTGLNGKNEKPDPPGLKLKIGKQESKLSLEPGALKMKLSTDAKEEPLSPKSPVSPVSPNQIGPLKVRIPKAGAYMDTTLKDDNPYEFKDEPSLLPSPGLRFKVSNGKLITGNTGTPKKQPPGRFTLLGASKSKQKKVIEPPGEKAEVSDSDDEDQLVVDENPQTKKANAASKKAAAALPGKSPPAPVSPRIPGENTTSTTLKPGSLKMKLSCKSQDSSGPAPTPASLGTSLTPASLKLKLPFNKSMSQDGSSETTPPSGVSGASVTSTPQLDPADTSDVLDTLDRLNMPTIRGGLNGSIADILEASGYGTETDFQIDEDIGRAASPSMRDAIQGMLSMSRMGSLQITHPLMSGPGGRPSIKLQRTKEEEGDRMQTCFKDEEFVYPTLDLSDNEDEFVFKPRGKPKKDETWNPKAKLVPNCPKPERPQREGTRRESVQSGLEAAAAKLANKPRPKRPYIRKKPKPEKLSGLSQSHSGAMFSDEMEPQPGTSAMTIDLSSSTPDYMMKSALTQKRPACPESPTKGGKKARKGQATAKQRLGKILKIHKMLY